MADKTGISWTDATWNPVRGCSRVSEGCRNCYAEVQAARIVHMGKGAPTAYDGLVKLVERDVRQFKMVGGEPTGDFRTVRRTEARWTGEVRLVPEALGQPLRWSKPRRIFVNSMSDLFHESLTNEQIAAVFGVMAAAPQHTFQVLTKRAGRMREWFEWLASTGDLGVCMVEAFCFLGGGSADDAIVERLTAKELPPWPLPNVWLGVSVENQAAAGERVPELLRTPAAVRILSCEPLLDEVDLLPWFDPTGACCGGFDGCPIGGTPACPSSASWRHTGPDGDDPTLDWVIAGCESGPGARECRVEWLRSLRDQCAAAQVPFFLKQAVKGGGSFAEFITGARRMPGIWFGPGSKQKPGGVVELPYLDGVQHAAFPETR